MPLTPLHPLPTPDTCYTLSQPLLAFNVPWHPLPSPMNPCTPSHPPTLQCPIHPYQWECWDPGLGPNVVRLPVHLPPLLLPDTSYTPCQPLTLTTPPLAPWHPLMPLHPWCPDTTKSPAGPWYLLTPPNPLLAPMPPIPPNVLHFLLAPNTPYPQTGI